MERLRDLCGEGFPEAVASRDEVNWSIGMIFSRGWKIEEGNWVLLPLADMFNHSFTLFDENNMQQESNGYTVCSLSDTGKDEEVFIRYNCDDNAQLLVLYGFVEAQTPPVATHVIVEVELDFLLDPHSVELQSPIN